MADVKEYGITLNEKEYIVTIEETGENVYSIGLNGKTYPVAVREIPTPEPEPTPGPEPEETPSPSDTLVDEEYIITAHSDASTETENGEDTEDIVESDDEEVVSEESTEE